MPMNTRRAAIVATILLALQSMPAARGQAPVAPPPSVAVPLKEAVLARLPPDWREPAALLRATDAQQQQALTGSEEALRQALIRLLSRIPAADGFVKTKLVNDPSPRVRTAIVTAVAADRRWTSMPDTEALLRGVVSGDPDPAVSLSALDALRRSHMRDLSALLRDRLTAARASGDAATVRRLTAEQERWISLERGTMLPGFLLEGPPSFTVKPAGSPVRVLAFGDFGTGSPAQIALGKTIASYHQRRPLDLALTLGDNFYSVGMESPSDPRWQTQFEQLYGGLGITFYPALGNHDWGHPDSPAAEILYSGKTSTWKMPASYYTFTAGPVQFFALDTQSLTSDKQLAWLDAELGRSQSRWKVVYGHHPIYSGGNYEERPDLISRLLPILQGRADAYLAGHDHNLQALRPEGSLHFYIAGGGGAGLYDLRPYDRSIFASRANGFAVIDGDDQNLTVSLVDATGKVVFEETLKKGPKSSVAGPGR
jgi:tartrate-resistant acid phosphatase type 5